MTSFGEAPGNDDTTLFCNCTADSLPIVVINLDREVERWNRMQTLLQSLELSARRVSAVDAKSEQNQFLYELAKSKTMVTPTGMAAFLSHRKVWSQLASSPVKWAVILEDDLHISQAASRLLKSTNWFSERADLIKVETFRRKATVSRSSRCIDDNHKLRTLNGKHVGAAGYIVAARAVPRLLQESQEITVDVDQFLFNPQLSPINDLVRMQIDPALCIQDQRVPAHHQIGIVSSLSLERENFAKANNDLKSSPKKRTDLWTKIRRRWNETVSFLKRRGKSNIKKRIRINLNDQWV
ncbi:MAG: glycosyltransferase family 25 protein [Pseudomonadota bacterium]